jgi:hypothetical protein
VGLGFRRSPARHGPVMIVADDVEGPEDGEDTKEVQQDEESSTV